MHTLALLPPFCLNSDLGSTRKKLEGEKRGCKNQKCTPSARRAQAQFSEACSESFSIPLSLRRVYNEVVFGRSSGGRIGMPYQTSPFSHISAFHTVLRAGYSAAGQAESFDGVRMHFCHVLDRVPCRQMQIERGPISHGGSYPLSASDLRFVNVYDHRQVSCSKTVCAWKSAPGTYSSISRWAVSPSV